MIFRAWQADPYGLANFDNSSSEYGECDIPFYECNFSILGFHLPFNSFEIEVLNHLMISPSQLNPMSWAYIKVLYHLCDYLGGKSFLSLFFHPFRVTRSSLNHK